MPSRPAAQTPLHVMGSMDTFQHLRPPLPLVDSGSLKTATAHTTQGERARRERDDIGARLVKRSVMRRHSESISSLASTPGGTGVTNHTRAPLTDTQSLAILCSFKSF